MQKQKAADDRQTAKAFRKWQDDLYDRRKDQLLRDGYHNPNAAMKRGHKTD